MTSVPSKHAAVPEVTSSNDISQTIDFCIRARRPGSSERGRSVLSPYSHEQVRCQTLFRLPPGLVRAPGPAGKRPFTLRPNDLRTVLLPCPRQRSETTSGSRIPAPWLCCASATLPRHTTPRHLASCVISGPEVQVLANMTLRGEFGVGAMKIHRCVGRGGKSFSEPTQASPSRSRSVRPVRASARALRGRAWRLSPVPNSTAHGTG